MHLTSSQSRSLQRVSCHISDLLANKECCTGRTLSTNLKMRDPAHALRIAVKHKLHRDYLLREVWSELFNKRHARVPDSPRRSHSCYCTSRRCSRCHPRINAATPTRCCACCRVTVAWPSGSWISVDLIGNRVRCICPDERVSVSTIGDPEAQRRGPALAIFCELVCNIRYMQQARQHC